MITLEEHKCLLSKMHADVHSLVQQVKAHQQFYSIQTRWINLTHTT